MNLKNHMRKAQIVDGIICAFCCIKKTTCYVKCTPLIGQQLMEVHFIISKLTREQKIEIYKRKKQVIV